MASSVRASDLLAVAAALSLIVVSALAGRALLDQGQEILLPTPPLLAFWRPHLGWGTPLVLACLGLGLALLRRAAVLPWRRLLLAGWLLNLAWLMSLALVDGLQAGWVEVLLDPNEYLHDLPRIGHPIEVLATFTEDIAFAPGEDGDDVWTTHVAAHPPLATLVFWALDRIGLGGGFWAGALCILAASLAAVALPVTLRELGAPAAARRLVPFVALFPGAVWMAVSADGLFAGVGLAGLALAVRGAVRRSWSTALAGGVLLGTTVYLSYGLVLLGIPVLAVLVLTVRSRGRRVLVGWSTTAAGALAVAAAHFALGFNWLVGLAELRVRYYQGVASLRPFGYFVHANVAAWLVSCSPGLAVGVTRAVRALGPDRTTGRVEAPLVAQLALAGVVAALVADLSALSKAETERIWLTFGLVAYAGMALVRGRAAVVWLLAGGGWAIGVNHLLDTGW